MQNSKVFKLLFAFTHQERQRFLDFLKSPYFNFNDDIIRCFVALLPSLQKTKPIEQNEAELWKKIYANKKFDKARFHRVCSDLLKEAERFLAYSRFAQQKSLQNAYLAQSLNEKKMMQHLPHLLKQAKIQHQKQIFHDSEFYYQQYLIEAEQNNFIELQKKRMDDKNLKTVMHNLDVFYLSKKLQYCIAILHYKNLTSVDSEIALMDEILSHLHKRAYDEYPIIHVQYIILQTLIDSDNEQHFQDLKLLFKRSDNTLPMEYLKEIYTFSIQYCIRKINAGLLKYFQEIFSLYKEGLKQKILINDGEISPYEYKNIITVGLRVNETDWTEKFINNYRKLLPPEHQENAYTFNIARLYFFQKKYDDVLNLLQQVEYNDVFYLLDSKITLLKTFYELREFDSLSALLDSFKMLLRRKKIISEEYRIIYTRFVMFLKKLSQVMSPSKFAQNRT